MNHHPRALVFAMSISVIHVGAINGQEAAPQPAIAKIETLQGTVLEKRSNVKSFEAWNAPSDPYYVLVIKQEGGDKKLPPRHVTLRPSKKFSTTELKAHSGMRVSIRGRFVPGKLYKPAAGESFPIEPFDSIEVDPKAKPIEPRPARRGSGFVVEEIRAQKD